MDERGNVRLVVPPGLALLTTAPPEREPSAPSFAWSRSRVRIAEVLLSEPTEPHELTVIAAQTGVSIAQVSNVLRAFDKLAWTKRRGPKRGVGVWRTLANPGSMLEKITRAIRGSRKTWRNSLITIPAILWDAVLGDLHRRAGNQEIAQRHRERALASHPRRPCGILRRRLATPA